MATANINLTPKKQYQGPIQRGTDPTTFRNTGRSVPNQSLVRPNVGGGGGSRKNKSPLPTSSRETDQSLPTSQDQTPKTATNLVGVKGFRQGTYTSDGKFFPTKNSGFIPKGYEKTVAVASSASGGVLVNRPTGNRYVQQELQQSQVNQSYQEQRRSVVSQVRKLTPQQFLSRGKENIVNIGRKGYSYIDQALPTGQYFSRLKNRVIKGNYEDRVNARLPQELIADRSNFLKSGKGTSLLNVRQKNFYEKLGIPQDADSDLLLTKYNKIREDFDLGRISSTKADQLQDEAIDAYTKKQLRKNIPKQVATAAILGALTAIAPPVGAVADVAFGTQAVLQRREISAQFKKYPKESALQAAGFLAGGLVGGKLGVLGASRLKLTAGDISQISPIVGSERAKLVRLGIEQLEPALKYESKNAKITNTIAYTLRTPEGKVFKILQFNKAVGENTRNLKGEPIILGFEVVKRGAGQKIIGRGVSLTTEAGTDTFLQAYRFKPVNSPVKRILQKYGFAERPRSTTILERSTELASRSRNGIRQSIVESRQKTLSNSVVSRSLAQRITSLSKKLDKGQKIPLSEIKNLFNLERRANGERPFTDVEFLQQAKNEIRTLSDLRQVLNRAKTKINVQMKSEARGNIGRISQDIRSDLIGKAKSETVSQPFQKKIPTSISRKTKGISARQFGKQIDRVNAGSPPTRKPAAQRLVEKTQRQFSKLRSTPSFAAVSALVERKRGSIPRGTAIKTGLRSVSFISKQKAPTTIQRREGAFSGQGTYERTDTQTFNIPKSFSGSKQNSNLRSVSLVRFATGELSSTAESQRPLARTSQPSRNAERTAQLLRQRQLQALQQRQRLREAQKSPSLSRPRPLTKIKAPIPFAPFGLAAVAANKRSKQRLRSTYEKFDVYTRQGKRLNKIPLSKRSAYGFGFKKIDTNLKASFFIRRTNRPGFVRSSALERTASRLQSRFRPSKRIPGLLVELPKYRLEKRGRTQEIKEIQRFKRLKSIRKPFRKLRK